MLLNIPVIALTEYKLADRGASIAHIDIHHTLVTIKGDDGKLVGRLRKLNARYVAVTIKRHSHLACDMALDIIGQHLHLAVLLASHRVLIAIGMRIVGIFLQLWAEALKHLHLVEGHIALVEAHPRQHLAVGAKVKGTTIGKLLFVHPVRNTIEHVVELAVLRHLTLAIIKEQLDKKEIIIPDKSHLIAVGREERLLLRAILRQWLNGVIAHSIDVILRSLGVAIDGLGVGLQQYTALVG